MADYNLKDDLLGFGRSQLKYMLFHNSTLADLDEYSYRKGLFFYDTDLDSLEFIKDSLTGWHSAISMVSSNNPSFVSDNDISDRFLIGAKEYSVARGFNPGVAGFLVIDGGGYPISQNKILFEDIEPTDYTTVISAPGLDTRFATEKAIVDYVAAATFSAQDNILDWDGTKYLPYASKKGTDPSYPYFYIGNTNPSFTTRLNLDALLYVPRVYTINSNGTAGTVMGNGGDILIFDSSNNLLTYLSGADSRILSYTTTKSTPIYIGATDSSAGRKSQHIKIDDFLDTFTVDFTTFNIARGIANKYLYLDASKNITYVDAPSGGVTPVDNILDWNTDAYKPYTSKTAASLYTGITVPDAIATVLNYDGVFRATQLYEGSTRVMTTHGNWTANGSLHAVTTSSHAGFCPQLPSSATGLFLRDDGTWGSIFWKRTGTTLSSFTSDDNVIVTVTGVINAIQGASQSGFGVYGSANAGAGVRGSSNSSYGGYFTSTSGNAVYGFASLSGTGGYFTSSSGLGIQGVSTSSIGGQFNSTSSYAIVGLINPSSTNTIESVLRLIRTTSGTAANGIGLDVEYIIEMNSGSTVTASTQAVTLIDATSSAPVADFVISLVNGSTSLVEKLRLTGAGELIVANAKLTGLATYADNTAATGGGLTAGQIYRTSTGELMVTY